MRGALFVFKVVVRLPNATFETAWQVLGRKRGVASQESREIFLPLLD
jgi:hypothetical protein